MPHRSLVGYGGRMKKHRRLENFLYVFFITLYIIVSAELEGISGFAKDRVKAWLRHQRPT